ncbi:zinc ribbon domain-containing protein [uncultured Methanobrevibacter sp.]|uniref:zinc ribbon domain-containing protein n=1 Tax=uncultured Methanobrevibacter sp. TaxID=253161 RepID=UPI0025EBDAD2|nr:zinc ribbon domain-containing protein [uncultured Methanobrevibacter sp.]
MGEKICINCGETVNDNANFCPNCKSTSFRHKAEVTANSKPSIIHSLFYWEVDGKYILAKSKLAAIFTFAVMILSTFVSPVVPGMIILTAIFTLLVFLIGYLGHYFKFKPSKAKLDNNDLGFITDLKHLLFYWQSKKTGEYVLSKTKVFSILIFIIFSLIAVVSNSPALVVYVVIGLIFAIPASIIGFVIHKITYEDDTNAKRVSYTETQKMEPPKKTVETAPQVSVHEFDEYERQLDDLKNEYYKKDSRARELIEKKFEPPQMTYTKFISVVDSSTKLFNQEADNISNIIRLASEDSPRIESEIKSKFNTLNSISDKLDGLIDELVLSLDPAGNDDVEGLLGDMENLIDSIKNYD